MSDHDPRQPWEPNPRAMGNWRAMFEQPRGAGPSPTQPVPNDLGSEDAVSGVDLREYRPWIVQRARTRPVMMLELRRYDARAGLWRGWAFPYHCVVGIEFIGDRLLSLDLGARQFVIEGRGLDELARHIRLGSAESIVEHADRLWSKPESGGLVTAIKLVLADPAPSP